MANKAVILCVDDEELPLTLRKLVLEKAGYEVITALSAATALQVLKTTKVDLVLSDHLMPATTGAELARELKANYPRLPVVLLSGVNEVPIGADIADAFISKVEGPERLCAEIALLLELDSYNSAKA
jgi:CheY-like chemotaxis protein